MQIRKLTDSQYEQLSSCPFCGGIGLTADGDDCPHFVVAFQWGEWYPEICPPVFCDGFRYQQKPMTQALANLTGIVCHIKPMPFSGRHPRIEAFFCMDPEKAIELCGRFLRRIFTGANCTTCGNDSAVVLDEENEIVCALCGSPAEPTK